VSKTAKILIIVVVIILLLCACLCAIGFLVFGSAGVLMARNVVTNEADVQSIASGIAEFTLPQDYHAEYGMRLAGMALVGYARDDGRGHILMLQAPATVNLSPEVMQRQLEQAARGQGYGEYGQLKAVGSKDVTIRDQQVHMIVSEGINSEGTPVRALSGMFTSRGGSTLLVIMGQTAAWDDAGVDAFIASIR